MHSDATYEDLTADLYDAEKDKECRYALYDAEYEGGAGMPKNKLLFFMWSVICTLLLLLLNVFHDAPVCRRMTAESWAWAVTWGLVKCK